MSKCVDPENEQAEVKHDYNGIANPMSDTECVFNDVSQTGHETTYQTKQGIVVTLPSSSDSTHFTDTALAKNSSEVPDETTLEPRGQNHFPLYHYFYTKSSSSTSEVENTTGSIKEKLKHRLSKYSSITAAPTSNNSLNSEPSLQNTEDEHLPESPDCNENTKDGNSHSLC